MNRFAFIIIILFLILLIGSIAVFFYFTGQEEQTGGTPEERGFFETIFPFIGTSSDRPFTETPDTGDDGLFNEPTSNLKQITREPIVSAVIFEPEDSLAGEVVRYIERETGHIYEVNPETGSRNRISNTTIPGIRRAIWSPNGENVIFQFVASNGAIESFSTEIPSDEGGTLEGSNLSANIQYISAFDDEIGYTLVDEFGTRFIRSNYDGRAAVEVFFTPLRELTISWPRETRIAFATKPSVHSLGSGFSVNTGSELTKSIGSGFALSVLQHPTTDIALVSTVDTDGFVPLLSTYSGISGEIQNNVFYETVVDKCVWSKTNEVIIYCAVPDSGTPRNYPDDWYKGLVFSSDELWKINTDTLTAESVVNLEEVAGEAIDVVDLITSPGGEYLIFTNKRDLSLWSLRLEEAQNEEGGEEEL